MASGKRTQFEKAADSQQSRGVLAELWAFMRQNKKWWLIPLIVAFVLIGALAFFASTGLAPFIYTLF
jgi:hypothetical protein